MDETHQARTWLAQESNSLSQGSVRVARERMQAGERLEPPPRAPGRPRPADSLSDEVPLSHPSPTAQWPLQEEAGTRSQLHRPIVLQKPPPRRPPRPSYIPYILDVPKVQGYIYPLQYQQQTKHLSSRRQDAHEQQAQGDWEAKHGPPQELDIPRAGLSGPSISSRHSTTSSYGSIPDFPAPFIPTAPQFQRHISGNHPSLQGSFRKSIGPPPSSRRGASSYYSHSSYVAPILEEVPESPKKPGQALLGPHDSFSSSHAIPQSWSDGLPNYYSNYVDDDEDDFLGPDGRNSRESDHDESSDLVRKASLGKQYKPTLTTVRSSGSLEVGEVGYASVSKPPTITNRGAHEPITVGIKSYARNIVAHEERSGCDSDIRADNHDCLANSNTSKFTQHHSSGEQDPRVKQIMGGLEKGGAIERGFMPPTLISPVSTTLYKLDVDAVHEAEARGSLTSLTDLIRRATRVRSNLDRGKTASRLGMLDFATGNPNYPLEKGIAIHKRSSDSLSGILASFPAPTPQGDRPNSRWPSPFANSNLNLHAEMAEQKKEQDSMPKIRRCCGLPVWACVVLFILMLCLIAAAIAVPLLLIVFPRQREQASSGSDLLQCVEAHPCANGGQSAISADSCSCICTGGFTGADCLREPELDCTTTDIEGFTNATVGSSIPRLLSLADPRFSVPLNATSLLASFSLSNLSCSDEEALITLNGRTQRRGLLNDGVPRPAVTAVPPVIARAPQLSTPSIITSNGVILDPSGETPIPTAQRVDGVVPAPTLTGTSNTATPDPNNLEFARVAILWVMQETGLDTAVDAQQALRGELSDVGFTAQGVNIGNGITIDVLQQTIVSNDTIIGA